MEIGKVSFKKEHRQETIIYLALWLLMFMAPVLSLGIRTAYSDDISFDWNEVMMVWREYIPFFMVFLIHNHLHGIPHPQPLVGADTCLSSA